MSAGLFIFYVYAYLREDGTPYYIGKGRDNRAYKNHKHITVPKDKSRIIIVERNLSEIGAFALERRLIRWYGRKDSGTGMLRNLTDGGEGAVGTRLGSVPSERRKRISEKLKGRKLSKSHIDNIIKSKNGENNPMFGKRLSHSHRELLSKHNKGSLNSFYGKTHTEDTKEKMRNSAKNRPKFLCIFCGRYMTKATYSQYHGYRCKERDITYFYVSSFSDILSYPEQSSVCILDLLTLCERGYWDRNQNLYSGFGCELLNTSS